MQKQDRMEKSVQLGVAKSVVDDNEKLLVSLDEYRRQRRRVDIQKAVQVMDTDPIIGFSSQKKAIDAPSTTHTAASLVTNR